MAEHRGCHQPCWEGREGRGQRQLLTPAPRQPQGRCRVSHQRSLPLHPAASQSYLEGTWSRSSGVCRTTHPLYQCHGDGKAKRRWGAGQEPGAKVAIAVLFLQHPGASSFLGSPFSFPLHMPHAGDFFPPLLLATTGIHQPSTAEREGQRNSPQGIHSLPPCGSIHCIASGGLFQLKVFD